MAFKEIRRQQNEQCGGGWRQQRRRGAVNKIGIAKGVGNIRGLHKIGGLGPLYQL